MPQKVLEFSENVLFHCGPSITYLNTCYCIYVAYYLRDFIPHTESKYQWEDSTTPQTFPTHFRAPWNAIGGEKQHLALGSRLEWSPTIARQLTRRSLATSNTIFHCPKTTTQASQSRSASLPPLTNQGTKEGSKIFVQSANVEWQTRVQRSLFIFTKQTRKQPSVKSHGREKMPTDVALAVSPSVTPRRSKSLHRMTTKSMCRQQQHMRRSARKCSTSIFRN